MAETAVREVGRIPKSTGCFDNFYVTTMGWFEPSRSSGSSVVVLVAWLRCNVMHIVVTCPLPKLTCSSLQSPRYERYLTTIGAGWDSPSRRCQASRAASQFQKEAAFICIVDEVLSRTETGICPTMMGNGKCQREPVASVAAHPSERLGLRTKYCDQCRLIQSKQQIRRPSS